MPWSYELAERDHDLQNPTSPEKVRLVGEYMRLAPGSRVLDLACGKGAPARILAASFGCRVRGIELRPEFADEGRRRTSEAGLAGLIEIETADASKAALQPDRYDAALCLGATFIWGTIAETTPVLRAAVRPGGFVAIGEPYWREPAGDDLGYTDLAGTVDRFSRGGVALTGLVASSEDDWDRYESLHWRALEEWLEEAPDHPEAAERRELHERRRREHLDRRARLGWAIFVGRRPAR